MPKVSDIDQLLNRIADRVVQPFSRKITFPRACRQLAGPTAARPFRSIEQFVPEAGSVVDISSSPNLPNVDKIKGHNISLPVDRFKGIPFMLEDRDYSELTGLGNTVAPSVLTETAEQLAQYINP